MASFGSDGIKKLLSAAGVLEELEGVGVYSYDLIEDDDTYLRGDASLFSFGEASGCSDSEDSTDDYFPEAGEMVVSDRARRIHRERKKIQETTPTTTGNIVVIEPPKRRRVVSPIVFWERDYDLEIPPTPPKAKKTKLSKKKVVAKVSLKKHSVSVDLMEKVIKHCGWTGREKSSITLGESRILGTLGKPRERKFSETNFWLLLWEASGGDPKMIQALVEELYARLEAEGKRISKHPRERCVILRNAFVDRINADHKYRGPNPRVLSSDRSVLKISASVDQSTLLPAIIGYIDYLRSEGLWKDLTVVADAPKKKPKKVKVPKSTSLVFFAGKRKRSGATTPQEHSSDSQISFLVG